MRPHAVTALSFDVEHRDGRDHAEVTAVHDPDLAVTQVMRHLRGWSVSAPEHLGRALVDAGAGLLRHAHLYSRVVDGADLAGAGAAGPARAPGGAVVGPVEQAPAAFVPLLMAAFPPGHPDRHDHDDAAGALAEVAALLDGTMLGPLMACSRVAVHDGRVVGACLVNARPGAAPTGGAWITEVARDPAPRWAGLGAHLLRGTLARCAADGVPALGLAVTEGNPARRLYERTGFVHVEASYRVLVP